MLCFKCQQWGHTQNAYRKPARCEQCVGQHPTQECAGERASYANCGKKHRAWEKRDCPTFEVYRQRVHQKRIALFAQSAHIRSAALAPPAPLDNWTQVSRKRPSPSALADDTKRRPDRPTNVEQASRHPGQARLGFANEGHMPPPLQRRQSCSILTASSLSGSSFVDLAMDTGDEL